MKSVLEHITPKMAEKYLNNNKKNRTLRAGVTERYAIDMSTNNWTQCLAPIAFYEDGDIADGQHRLWAIVNSGKAQNFFVIHGLPREAGLNIDTGAQRSVVDNAKISGVDPNLTHELLAVCRFYHRGGETKSGESNATKMSYVTEHREAVSWTLKNGPHGRGFRNRIVLAGIARAHANGANEERLRAFGKVLSTGFSEGDGDSAAVALRTFIMTRGGRIQQYEQSSIFRRVQNVIWHFVNHKRLLVIKELSEERYPLKK